MKFTTIATLVLVVAVSVIGAPAQANDITSENGYVTISGATGSLAGL